MAKILIIEDDKLLLKVYRTNFEVMGYDIDTAADGEAGWQKIQQGGYGAILMDLKLPKLSGMQVLSLIKNEKTVQKNGPVIILSNIDDPSVIKEAMALGAVAYLHKDKVTPQTVVEAVGKWLVI